MGEPGNAEKETDALRAGRMFVLPSTYIHGDRYIRRIMRKIIAVSNKFGFPEIFLTMTWNPQLPDIKNAMLPGQTVTDGPDLAARALRIRIRALMKFLIDENVFS